MIGWYGGWGWGGWLAMSLMMLVFWGLLATGVVALIRFSRRELHRDGEHDARRLLDDRFARGEIDEQDYRHRRDLLAGR